MKILWNGKDGGPESKTWVWGIEIKGLFSVLLLRFRRGSRDAFHSHAFNAISWLLTGCLLEVPIGGRNLDWYFPSLRAIVTPRSMQHKVICMTDSAWVLTFRGPWADRWNEYRPNAVRKFVTLTHGRKEVTQ